MNCYIINPDGSLKLDSLGRRRHIKQNLRGNYGNRKGRPKGSGEGLKNGFNVRLTEEIKNELIKKASKQNIKAVELIRTYIVWGLENDGTEQKSS